MSKSKKILNLVTVIIVGILLVCTVLSVIIRNQTQPLVETVPPTEEYIEDLGGYLYHLPAEAMFSEPYTWIDENGEEQPGERWYVYVLRSGIGLFGTVYHVERAEVLPFEWNGDTAAVTSNRLHRQDEVIVRPVEKLTDGCTVRTKRPE